jgi:hypothetical protein
VSDWPELLRRDGEHPLKRLLLVSIRESPVRTVHRFLALSLAATAPVGLLSCASKTATGAAVGAAGGAVLGGAIGAAAGSTTKGAIIGAVVGGAAGAIIGAQMDKQAKELEQNIEGAKVERVGEGIQVTFESGLLYDFDSRPALRGQRISACREPDKYPNTDLLIVAIPTSQARRRITRASSERRSRSAAATWSASGRRPPTRGLGDDFATNETGERQPTAGSRAILRARSSGRGRSWSHEPSPWA